jgi:glycerophosphoryl diester phosphodiesterase
MSYPLLLGHRGARATQSIPENSIASFDLALEHGCDGVEFDVRLSSDGQAVICHDPEFSGRTIAQSRAGDFGELCSLDRVLARYQATAFLDIELKVPGLEAIVLHGVKKHPPHKGYVVTSFLPEVLLALRSRDREMPLGLICETTAQLRPWRELPVQFVAPHHTLIDIDALKELHAAGRKVLAWTVNTRDRMVELRDLGVDGIISDRTQLLARLRP